jgi:hypothetical protein
MRASISNLPALKQDACHRSRGPNPAYFGLFRMIWKKKATPDFYVVSARMPFSGG